MSNKRTMMHTMVNKARHHGRFRSPSRSSHPQSAKSNFCAVKGFSPVILHTAISSFILNRAEIIRIFSFTLPRAT
uniref:Uncharacterized protein n=1 Tax=Klebsiella quasipneumoniae TaxID=1463165 RepID=A0A866WPB4_9ENTR|nr:Hypothetical protein [Klebsiella quasipneumoniae]